MKPLNRIRLKAGGHLAVHGERELKLKENLLFSETVDE